MHSFQGHEDFAYPRHPLQEGSGSFDVDGQSPVGVAVNRDLPGPTTDVAVLNEAPAGRGVDHEKLRLVAPGTHHHRLVFQHGAHCATAAGPSPIADEIGP